jgi:alcohol dehydrogenase
MKAIQLKEPQSFHAIDIAEPAAPGPGEALLRIHRVGICGTDLGGFLGKMPFYSYPRIPGHELGVEVLAVGANVTNVAAGDRCSVEPYLNCQKCYSCRRGLTNCCATNQTLGVMCDGGLCERMLLPARKLHVSRKLSYDQLALVETLAIGCHAVDRARVAELGVVDGAIVGGDAVVSFVLPTWFAGGDALVISETPVLLAMSRLRVVVADEGVASMRSCESSIRANRRPGSNIARANRTV